MSEFTTKEVKYADMVAALIKDGGLILESLTPEKCNILHMAVGLAGEGGELLDCVLNAGVYHDLPEFLSNCDRVNAVEESGDLEFYLEGLTKATETPFVMPEYQISVADPLRLAAQISVASSDVLDQVKKYVIYGKDGLPDDYLGSIGTFVMLFAEFYALTGITREEAQEANKVKLLTGEKARYKLGAYTDQQAQDRADKDGVQ